MKLTTLEAIISLKESSQVEYKKAKNDFPNKAISSVEVIHHWGETYDIIKHLFYKDTSDL